MKTLTDLPDDTIYFIMILIQDDGSSLRYLAQTCTTIYKLFHNLRLGGLFAQPVRLPKPAVAPRGLDLTMSPTPARHPVHCARTARLDTTLNDDSYPNEALQIRKNSTPGVAYIKFEYDVTQISSAWSVRLDKFHGTRIEIGIATQDAFRFNTVERASSWMFDSFGRANCAGSHRTFGRAMRAGETITVIYDVSRKLLSFHDQSTSMGSLRINTPNGIPLCPFIYFPALSDETVTVFQPGRVVINLAHLYASAQEYARRVAESPQTAKIGRLIVLTWDDRIWYSVKVDIQTTSLAQLWKIIETRHGMPMHLFELIFKGRRLPNSDSLNLHHVGIHFDKTTGSCSSDILLSVPHIVS